MYAGLNPILNRVRLSKPRPGASRTSRFTGETSQNLAAAKAGQEVIVDHAGSLHVGVANRRADELEAALLEILAQGVGLGAGGWVVCQIFEAVHDRLAVDEAPDVSIETAKLCLNV